MSAIIQDKLTHYWDFRSGTIDDFVGSADGTFGSTPVFSRGGLKFDGVDDYVNLGSTFAADFSSALPFTISIYFKVCETLTNTIFGRYDPTGTRYLQMYLAAGKATARCGQGGGGDLPTIDSTGTYAKGAMVHMTYTYDGSANTRLYVDGVSVDSSAVAPSDFYTTFDTYVGGLNNNGSLSNPIDVGILAIGFSDEELDSTEISQLFGEMADTVFPTRAHSTSQVFSVPNLNESGLVGAWNMKPSAGSIVDLSTSGKDGTLLGAPNHVNTILGDFLKFDGTDDVVDIGDTTQTVSTVAFWINPSTTSEDIMDLDGGTHTIEVGTGTITATGFDTPTIYVDGAVSSTLIANVFQRVVITTATGIVVNNFDIGKETTYFDGLIGDPEIYSDAKDIDWVRTDYKKGASAVQYKSSWGTSVSTANVTGGILGDSEWKVGSGTWQIDTATINGQKCKVFNCVVAGILYLPIGDIVNPTEVAYGTWDFWVNHANASTTDIGFATGAASIASGYGVTVASDESVKIVEYAVGDVTATGGTLVAATWTNVRVTRDFTGAFVLSIDGTAADTGTDTTTTTATHVALDFDAGDKLAISDLKGNHSFNKYLGII